MANRHLLFALGRQSRLALARAKLLTVPAVVLLSLFAFVISASTGPAWPTHTQLASDADQIAARRALELRLLQAEAANLRAQEQHEADETHDDLMRQLILARALLDEQLAASSPLSSSPPNGAAEQQLIDLVELGAGEAATDSQLANQYYRVVNPTGAFDEPGASRARPAPTSGFQDDDSDEEFNTKLSSFSSPYAKLPPASPVVPNEAASVELAANAAEGLDGRAAGARFAATTDKRQASDEPTGADLAGQRARPAKFTTLLEDEQLNSTAGSTTTTARPSDDKAQPATTASYAKLIRTAPVDSVAEQQHQSATSVFGRLFGKLASYVPFLAQNRAAAPAKAANMTSGAKKAPEPGQPDGGRQLAAAAKDTVGAGEATDARQRVSTAEGAPGKPEGGNDNPKQPKQQQQQQQPGDEVAGASDDKTETNDNKSSERRLAQVSISRAGPDDESDSFASLGTFDRAAKSDRRVFVNTNMKRVALDESVGQLAGAQNQPEGLVLPATFNPSAPFEGKYIYAPQQHYYISAAGGPGRPAPGNLFAADGGDPTRSTLGHRPAMLVKHHQVFHPNEHIFATYEPLKSAYAYGKPEGFLVGGGASGGLEPGKSPVAAPNDLYFLIMVGAFCVMAMAVVLAAGLFAYRVQQNRKSSQDTDYPTYGVVGPNNMNGKCGAAAFVGGYLGNNIVAGGGPGSSGSFGSQKSACSANNMKHLPDLYASDSGLASTDKGSSKKGSLASASSDNNNNNNSHQQQSGGGQQAAGHRGAPANFMMANQDAARMYHYQHQKQQMIISDRSSAGRHTSASDLDSDEENEDGSYTVYECPGLASAHEMEIKNPLFNDDQTP